jgi:hypothetical protein
LTDYSISFFADDAAVRRIGEGLLARTLPRPEWTHEAHLAACLWLLDERPEIALEQELPGIIRAYNESVGGVNDDTQGYHETLTQLYIRGVRHFAADFSQLGLSLRVNALLASPIGARDWPLRFYSHEVLFSVAARKGWVEPDLSQIT